MMSDSGVHDSSTDYGQYKGDLWDKFTEIMAKMNIGKQNVKDLQALTKSQSDAFDYMGKPLSKTKMLVEDKNLYTVMFSAKCMLSYGQNIGQKQIAISQELNKKLYVELTDLRKELSKAIKNAIKDEKKLRSDLANAKSAAASAKKKDHEEAKNFESLKEKMTESDSLPPKKAQQLQAQTHKADKSAQQANKAYTAAHEALVKMDETYYVKLGELMHSLEVLDRKRLHATKSVLMRYHNMQLELAQMIMSECDTMRQAFDQISADTEIRTFVSNTRSGASPPAVEPFEPYVMGGGSGSGSGSGHSTPVSSRPQSFNNTPTIGSPSSVSSTQTPVSPTLIPPPVLSPTIEPVYLNNTPPPFVSTSAPAPSSQSSGEMVRALYDYDPTEQGELSFKENDILVVLDKNPDGWWFGEMDGRKGLFPSNFVEPVVENQPVAHSVAASAAPSNKVITTALYDYDAQDAQELSFKEGEIIEVLQKNEDGWWYGSLPNGAMGLFPSNFTSGGCE